MREKQKKEPLKVKEWLVPIISSLLTTLYMPIFMYATNSDEVKFVEVLPPIGIFLLIAIVIFGMSALLFKLPTKASLITMLFILLLENYHYLEKGVQIVIPRAKYWHVLPVCVFVLLHICYLTCAIWKEETRKTVCGIIGLVMGALILVNFVSAIPNIINKLQLASDNGKQTELTDINIEHDGANIYYFLFDEAAPFNVIEEYYESDMSEMRKFLEEKHFVVSEKAYNDSTNTKVVLTNILNLDYVANGSMSATQLSQLRSEAPLQEVLSENGYVLHGVGDTSWLFIDSLTVNQQAEAETIDGKSFEQIVMDTTFLYPFWEKSYSEEQEIILGCFDYFSEEIYGTSSEFKFVYMCCPHQPFLFDENGNLNSAANYNNWSAEEYYLGQYKFVMKKLQEVIESIVKNDPNSIIIVASDHGPRFNSEIPYEKVKNVLQAVYYKGENIEELRDLSGVNTLRSILAKQLGLELPFVEVP